MSQELDQNHDALARRVRQSLEKAERYASRVKRTNTRLLVFGVFNSGVSTLVTGVTAAQGPVVGEGIPGWRMACIVGAVFGFATTVSMGLNQQLKLSERLSRANQCLGRLKFLDVAMDTGSRTWAEISEEYEEILRTYPDIVG
jgi:hypothetical protein